MKIGEAETKPEPVQFMVYTGDIENIQSLANFIGPLADLDGYRRSDRYAMISTVNGFLYIPEGGYLIRYQDKGLLEVLTEAEFQKRFRVLEESRKAVIAELELISTPEAALACKLKKYPEGFSNENEEEILP